MDYNYVRMRNAAHMGDRALTEHYRRLYEAEPVVKNYSQVLNYIIILLALIALGLGIFIISVVLKETKTASAVFEFCRLWGSCLC